VKSRRSYPTDLSDEEWAILQPLVPEAKPGGRPRTHETRELLDAIFYVVRGGCAWRLLPHDFPTAGRPPTTTSGCGASMAPGRRSMLLCGSEPVLGKVAKKPLARPSWTASR
jgi:transposase